MWCGVVLEGEISFAFFSGIRYDAAPTATALRTKYAARLNGGVVVRIPEDGEALTAPAGRLNRPGRPGSCSPQPCHRLPSHFGSCAPRQTAAHLAQRMPRMISLVTSVPNMNNIEVHLPTQCTKPFEGRGEEEWT